MYFEDKQNNVKPLELLIAIAVLIVLAVVAVNWIGGGAGLYSPCEGAKCPAGTTPIRVKTSRYSSACACSPTEYAE